MSHNFIRPLSAHLMRKHIEKYLLVFQVKFKMIFKFIQKTARKPRCIYNTSRECKDHIYFTSHHICHGTYFWSSAQKVGCAKTTSICNDRNPGKVTKLIKLLLIKSPAYQIFMSSVNRYESVLYNVFPYSKI